MRGFAEEGTEHADGLDNSGTNDDGTAKDYTETASGKFWLDCMGRLSGSDIFSNPYDMPSSTDIDKLGQKNVQTAEQDSRFRYGAYDIGYNTATNDVGAMLNGILGSITSVFFDWSKSIISVALWFLEWAYGFHMVQVLSDWAQSLSGRFNHTFFETGVDAYEILFTIICLYGGWQIVRGRLAKGLSEMLLSCVIYAALLVITATGSWPGGYLKDGFNLVGGFSGEMLAMANQSSGGSSCPVNGDTFFCHYGMSWKDSNEVSAYVSGKCGAINAQEDATIDSPDNAFSQKQLKYLCPATTRIAGSFIDQPYEYAQWGQLLDGECARYRDNVLLIGPWKDGDAPRDAIKLASQGKKIEDKNSEFGDEGAGPNGTPPQDFGKALIHDYGDGHELNCPIGNVMATFNSSATPERMSVTFLTLIASIIAGISIIVIAGTVAASQFIAAILMALAPFALAAGILPGAGRNALSRWAIGLLKAFMAVIVLSIFLVLLTDGIDTVMQATQDLNLIARFAVLILVAIMLAVARKKLQEGTGRALAGLGNQMMSMRVGSGGKGGGGGGGAAWQAKPMAEHNMLGAQTLGQAGKAYQQGKHGIQNSTLGRKVTQARQTGKSQKAMNDSGYASQMGSAEAMYDVSMKHAKQDLDNGGKPEDYERQVEAIKRDREMREASAVGGRGAQKKGKSARREWKRRQPKRKEK